MPAVIKKSASDEIKTLTALSKSAFDTDVEVGSDQIGGPPDYDSEKWHARMLKNGNLYTVDDGGKIIGGIIVFRDRKCADVMYLGRIFIDPALHGKGCGKEAMLLLEKFFPEIKTWRLETPVWNMRTNSFYPKLGYKEMYRDRESVYYQKQLD